MAVPNIFLHEIFVSVIVSVLLADTIKIMIYFWKARKINLMLVFKTGGMPSAHTACVTSMVTTVYLMEGISNLFVVTLIFSTLVIADAVGFRRSIGKQAEILNKIMDEIAEENKFDTKKLYELVGHTPKQVLWGGILGILVSNIIYYI